MTSFGRETIRRESLVIMAPSSVCPSGEEVPEIGEHLSDARTYGPVVAVVRALKMHFLLLLFDLGGPDQDGDTGHVPVPGGSEGLGRCVGVKLHQVVFFSGVLVPFVVHQVRDALFCLPDLVCRIHRVRGLSENVRGTLQRPSGAVVQGVAVAADDVPGGAEESSERYGRIVQSVTDRGGMRKRFLQFRKSSMLNMHQKNGAMAPGYRSPR